MAKPDRHIRIAGEIVIDLECIGSNSDPGCQGRNPCRILHLDAVPEHACIVRQKNLLPKSYHETVDTIRKLLCALRPRSQLRIDRLVLNDRPCNQLWKHRDVSAIGDDILLDGRIPAVHIDDIRYRLEGIKGDADRKRERKQRDRRAGQTVDGSQNKIRILEVCQKSEPGRHGSSQCHLCLSVLPRSAEMVDQKTSRVGDQNRYDHQKDVNRLPPCIKNKADKEKDQIPELCRDNIINKKNYRQKPEKKQQTAENHSRYPLENCKLLCFTLNPIII